MMLGLNNLNSNNKMSQNPQTENEMKFGESQEVEKVMRLYY